MCEVKYSINCNSYCDWLNILSSSSSIMLTTFLGKVWCQMKSTSTLVEALYLNSVQSLRVHVSMRPIDVWKRSIHLANWSTLLVIILCHPTLLIFRGLDLQLLFGVFFVYAVFWTALFLLILLVQIIWLINYCITQRFVENMLDFEIIDWLFGLNNIDDDDNSDLDEDAIEYLKNRGSG